MYKFFSISALRQVDVNKIALASNVASSIATVISVFVGFIGLLTGVTALYLSYRSIQYSIQYQETSLKPDLDMASDSGDLSISVVNNGLGPALIREVRIYFNGSCAESDTPDEPGGEEWQDKYSRILESFAIAMVGALKVDEDKGWYATRGYFTPGVAIKSGEKSLILKLHMPHDVSPTSIIEKNGISIYDRFNSTFGSADHILSVTFVYCSLSGNFCASTGWNRKYFCPIDRRRG